jgi:hypothetical protein
LEIVQDLLEERRRTEAEKVFLIMNIKEQISNAHFSSQTIITEHTTISDPWLTRRVEKNPFPLASNVGKVPL